MGPHSATTAPGDVSLLCSDGLSDPLADAVLREALAWPPREACAMLVQATFEAGSHDNFTAIVVKT